MRAATKRQERAQGIVDRHQAIHRQLFRNTRFEARDCAL
jgi:hypothetical protein